MEHRNHRVDDELILPYRANRADGIFGNDRSHQQARMIERRPDLRKKCVNFGSHRRAVSQSASHYSTSSIHCNHPMSHAPIGAKPMPLKRLNEAYVVELDGIGFGMLDEQWRKLRCLVTGAAITDAIGGTPTQAEQVEWFLSNRSSVEQVAAAKFDQRTFENDGSIRVGTRDLNPHLFAF